MHGFLKIKFETLTTLRVVWELFLTTISFFFKTKKKCFQVSWKQKGIFKTQKHD